MSNGLLAKRGFHRQVSVIPDRDRIRYRSTRYKGSTHTERLVRAKIQVEAITTPSSKLHGSYEYLD